MRRNGAGRQQVSTAYVAGVLRLAVVLLSPRNITRGCRLNVRRLCPFQRRANYFLKGRIQLFVDRQLLGAKPTELDWIAR